MNKQVEFIWLWRPDWGTKSLANVRRASADPKRATIAVPRSPREGSAAVQQGVDQRAGSAVTIRLMPQRRIDRRVAVAASSYDGTRLSHCPPRPAADR
jgi:hypothetical protein